MRISTIPRGRASSVSSRKHCPWKSPERAKKPPQRYYECGIETVQQSQLLIALWDGGPGQGLGGTADMVRFADGTGAAGRLDP